MTFSQFWIEYHTLISLVLGVIVTIIVFTLLKFKTIWKIFIVFIAMFLLTGLLGTLKFMGVLLVFGVIYYFVRGMTIGKKIEVCKTALLGKYMFDSILSERQKEEVISFANRRLREGGILDRTIDDIDEKTRYLLIAYAIDELGIEHGLKGFHCIYIKNPFMIKTYDKNLWETASQLLEKDYGITIQVPQSDDKFEWLDQPLKKLPQGDLDSKI